MRALAGVFCLALLGCVAPVGEAPSPQAPDPLPAFDTPLPDVGGEWLVMPEGSDVGELWRIKQVGNTITGTIVPEPLPSGVAIDERPLLGTFEEGAGGWMAMLEMPAGTLVPRGNTGFAYCPRKGGLAACQTGLKRALPSPWVSPPSTTSPQGDRNL